jgi:hypothetical protein
MNVVVLKLVLAYGLLAIFNMLLLWAEAENASLPQFWRNFRRAFLEGLIWPVIFVKYLKRALVSKD